MLSDSKYDFATIHFCKYGIRIDYPDNNFHSMIIAIKDISKIDVLISNGCPGFSDDPDGNYMLWKLHLDLNTWDKKYEIIFVATERDVADQFLKMQELWG